VYKVKITCIYEAESLEVVEGREQNSDRVD